MTITKIEITNAPDYVWAVKIKMPEQKYYHESETLDIFYNEQDARDYMRKECKRMADCMLNDRRIKVFKYLIDGDEFDYSFDALDENFNKITLRGYMYRKNIR
jgi:hypothetical protein